jgi:hypothetical protein
LLDPLGLNPEPKLVSNGAYVRENLLLRALVLLQVGGPFARALSRTAPRRLAEPLADQLLAHPELVPAQAAAGFVVPLVEVSPDGDKRPDLSTPALVLDGVRDLLSERWSEQTVLVQQLREL